MNLNYVRRTDEGVQHTGSKKKKNKGNVNARDENTELTQHNED